MSRRTYGYIAAAMATLLAALAIAVWRAPSRATPPVSLALLGGGSYTLPAADAKSASGRPVLLSFWATSCPPCVREVPMLNALHRELRPAGLDIVAIAMPYDAPANVFAFTQRRQVAYPVAFDLNGAAVRRFGIEAIPHTVLLDRAGNIAWQHVGLLNADTARAEALRVLAQR